MLHFLRQLKKYQLLSQAKYQTTIGIFSLPKSVKHTVLYSELKERKRTKNADSLSLWLKVTFFFFFFFYPCPLCVFLEEPSSDPCYPIRAVRGKNRWAACLHSSRQRFYCSMSITVSDLWRPLKLSGRHIFRCFLSKLIFYRLNSSTN